MTDRKKRVDLLILFALAILSFLFMLVVADRNLGGDDNINFLGFYNRVKNLSWIECITEGIKNTILRLNPSNVTRFFPLAAGSYLERKIFYRSIFMYRIWILAYTTIDMFLLALLVSRIVKNVKAGYCVLILSTISLNLWRGAEVNPLTTYEALVQRTFLFEIISLHLYLSWYENNKKINAVLGTVFIVMGCFVYEIGYFTIFYVLILASFTHIENIKDYIKKLLPAFLGTAFAVLIYLYSASGGPASDDTSIYIAPNAIFFALVKQVSSSFPLSGLIHGNEMVDIASVNFGDIIIPLVFATVLAVIVYNTKEYINEKDYLKFLLLGLLFLLLPALLISITVKFQSGPYTDWTSGWIVTIIGSFGLGIIFYTLIIGITQLVKVIYNNNIIIRSIWTMIVFISVLFCGIYSHAATSQTIANGRYNRKYYDARSSALENGLLTYAEELEFLVSGQHIWGGSYDAVNEYFVRYVGSCDFDSVFYDEYTEDQYVDNKTYYFDSCVVVPFSITYIGKIDDLSANTISDVYLYIDNEGIEEDIDITYRYIDRDGKECKVSRKVSEIGIADKEKNGCFVNLTDNNILVGTISIINKYDELNN